MNMVCETCPRLDENCWINCCEIGNHQYSEYTCPSCGTVQCWSCNPNDQRQSGGGVTCKSCNNNLRCWNCHCETEHGSSFCSEECAEEYEAHYKR